MTNVPQPQPRPPLAKTLADEMVRQVQSIVARVEGDKQARQLAAHQEAENALSMALHHLRTGAGNVPGAMRKAVQALAALSDLNDAAPRGRKAGAA